MTTNPNVSVVIPAYNAAEWIGESIYSACDQDYNNVEIIVVNDGSTDDTVKIAHKVLMTSELRRMYRIINLGNNAGACAALDIGFANASGKYACVLAADDAIAEQDCISEVVEAMERMDLDWCYNSIFITGKRIDVAKPIFTKWLALPIFDNLILQMPWLCKIILKHRNPINSSTMMIRMDTFRKEHLQWSRSGPRGVCDGVIIYDMLTKGLKGFSLHTLGAFYRDHDGQISKTKEFGEEYDKFKSV